MKKFVLEGTYRVYFNAKSMTGARSIGEVFKNQFKILGHDGALDTTIQFDGTVSEINAIHEDQMELEL